MGITHHLREVWPATPETTVLVTPEATVDAAGLWDRVDRARAWLRGHGLARGDVVALQTSRQLAFLEVHLACLAEGLTTLPLNPRYTADEIRWILGDASPALAILHGDRVTEHEDALDEATLRDLLGAVVEGLAPADVADEDDLALLCYTSGTTGRPKGARMSHGNVRAALDALHHAGGMSDTDALLHALPLFHIHGLVVAQMLALWSGARTEWLARFDAGTVLQRLSSGELTVFMGVPTFYHRLANHPGEADLSGVRLLTSGSAPLPASTWEAIRERTGHEVLERYGMTEVGIVLSNPLDGPRKPGSVGLPLPAVSLRIVDRETGLDCPPGTVGEVWIQGPSVFQGYLGRPEATAEALTDGWMHTGDLGLRDDDGYVHLRGRAGDLILCGGFNVYPPEVEAVLLDVPGVAEVAVVGRPHDDLGEEVVAFVVLHEAAAPEPADLEAAARERLAPYKVPRRLRWVDALPRNSMGKVDKARLRRLPMAAPLADAIRTLRPRVDRARRAAIDLSRLEGLSAEARIDPPDRMAGDLTAELVERWGSLDGLDETLAEAAAEAPALAARLKDLRHQQHDALHDPAFASLVAEVERVSQARSGLEARRGHLQRQLLVLDTLARAADDAMQRVRGARASIRSVIADATARALLTALQRGGVDDVVGPIEEASAWIASLPTVLSEERERLHPEATQLGVRVRAAAARLDQILG